MVGSACYKHFNQAGHKVIGIDNDSRGVFFGSDGSVAEKDFINGDILDRGFLYRIFHNTKFDVVIHCAAQPSHDKSAAIPVVDFNVNAVGTVNLLEELRQTNPNGTFIFLSTNKVYGANPNNIRMKFEDTRVIAESGVDEQMSLDHTTHSPFGVSKTAADLMVQEYGRYYGLNTVCLRCGCITGEGHKGVELHGFLNYMGRCFVTNKTYNIIGYQGKQTRDNLHVDDLVTAIDLIVNYPPEKGTVYNLGGGLENTCSVREALEGFSKVSGKAIEVGYIEEARKGDHLSYYTNYKKFNSYYGWKPTVGLDKIYERIYNGLRGDYW